MNREIHTIHLSVMPDRQQVFEYKIKYYYEANENN